MPRRGVDTPLTNRSEILRLWCLGWTPKRIADAGWCSARHVNQLLRGYEVVTYRSQQAIAERHARFAVDHAAGMTDQDIASKHGVTRNRVRKWRQSRHEQR